MTKKIVKFDEKELEADKEADSVVAVKDLEKKVKEANSKTSEIMLAAGPDLAKLSWDMYSQYRKGELKTYFDDDQELEAYYNIKKKETIINMVAFISMASAAIVDSDKIEKATIKELSSSMANAVDLVRSLMGEPDKVVKHEHEVKIDNPKEIKDKLDENKAKLDALDAEFEAMDKKEKVDL